MRLSWNEMRIRASSFSKEFENAFYEKGETQTFYEEFFNIFGIKRRRVASYESRVSLLNDKNGYIDLFWPKVLLVEQKSEGKNLELAYQQALDYCDGLKEYEFPRYILVCDFQNFELFDLDERKEFKFKLSELAKNVEIFGFMLGIEKREFKDQDPVNIKASELMGKLHDSLLENGFQGTELEIFLVRILFCLFADDTGIFDQKDMLHEYLIDRTFEDGSNLGGSLSKLFEVLNTPPEQRQKNLDDDLSEFPYINGGLFKDQTRIPDFNSEQRTNLLEAASFDWEKISPAIFGSLFQSVMDKNKRREFGEHYTSEKNILKLISSLFLDDLINEFQRCLALKRGKNIALKVLIDHLRNLTFFDPACGCGNFLIITYRELRNLEIEILKALHADSDQLILDITIMSQIDVDQFYGIEQSEFATKISEVALWMMDHLMNNKMSLEFGSSFVRIPLVKSPRIRHANALEISWEEVLPSEKCSYILGNPPFVGHQWRTISQIEDMKRVWGTEGSYNRLDYVSCWFKLASDFLIKNPTIKCAFVSTNSITQGEQAGILWPSFWNNNIQIFFAHRTFNWSNEARGKAAVHCVIIGFANQKNISEKNIFDYENLQGEPSKFKVKNINSYLVDGDNIIIPSRVKPKKAQLKMTQGSKPADGARIKDKVTKELTTRSNLILSDLDKIELLKKHPELEIFLKPYLGSDELINGQVRWCFWLKNFHPKEFSNFKDIQERLQRVTEGRLLSPTESVRSYAKTPWLFTQDRQPSESYLAIPEVSSESREFIPMTILSNEIIASNKLMMIPGCDFALLTLLSSTMHMCWIRTVAGRLKSDYSYSPAVYYSFPMPITSDENNEYLTNLAHELLLERKKLVGHTLGELYDPQFMPVSIRNIHIKIDNYVDKLYRKKKFITEGERVEFLFNLFKENV
jgi:type I restriction-modification system DNA methylase subunit